MPFESAVGKNGPWHNACPRTPLGSTEEDRVRDQVWRSRATGRLYLRWAACPTNVPPPCPFRKRFSWTCGVGGGGGGGAGAGPRRPGNPGASEAWGLGSLGEGGWRPDRARVSASHTRRCGDTSTCRRGFAQRKSWDAPLITPTLRRTTCLREGQNPEGALPDRQLSPQNGT